MTHISTTSTPVRVLLHVSTYACRCTIWCTLCGIVLYCMPHAACPHAACPHGAYCPARCTLHILLHAASYCMRHPACGAACYMLHAACRMPYCLLWCMLCTLCAVQHAARCAARSLLHVALHDVLHAACHTVCSACRMLYDVTCAACRTRCDTLHGACRMRRHPMLHATCCMLHARKCTAVHAACCPIRCMAGLQAVPLGYGSVAVPCTESAIYRPVPVRPS